MDSTFWFVSASPGGEPLPPGVRIRSLRSRSASPRTPVGHRLLAALAVVLLLPAACSTASGPPSTDGDGVIPSRSPVSSPGGGLASVRVRLDRVAVLDQPVAMAAPEGDDAIYIAERTGRVVAVRSGSVDGPPVLDIADKVSLGGEQGLLGLAFSPDRRFLYVNYTDLQGDTNVVEYAFQGGVADPGTARRVLFVDQPYSNHNGGNLVFGPDGYLYVGLGDGGSGGDPMGNAQNLGTLLGKMLRIDPRPSGGRPYGIPPDNPFVDRAGARPEIWAYGLRNPWRYSFDRETGDLWIADVGQDAWEEIDHQAAGSNGGEDYGWNLLEGSHPYDADSDPGSVRPVWEVSQDTGACAITGGYLYRGSRIPALAGAYVFTDFCLDRIFAIRFERGQVVADRAIVAAGPNVASFGEDQDGELYVLQLDGPVSKIVPAG